MDSPFLITLVEPRDVTAALGGLVRSLRQRAQLTQPELAVRAGVPATTLSRRERTGLASTDRRVIRQKNAEQLSAFYF